MSVESVCWRGLLAWCGGNIFFSSWSSSPLLSSFILGQGMLKSVLSVKGIKGFRRVGLAGLFLRQQLRRLGALLEEEKMALRRSRRCWLIRYHLLWRWGRRRGGCLLCGGVVMVVISSLGPWGADEGSRPIQVACSIRCSWDNWDNNLVNREIVDPCSFVWPPHGKWPVQLASIFRFEGVHGISFVNHPKFTMVVLIYMLNLRPSKELRSSPLSI